MKNSNLATPAAASATPVKPKMAATIATTRNTSAQYNITLSSDSRDRNPVFHKERVAYRRIAKHRAEDVIGDMACCKYFTEGGYKRKDCDIGYALAVGSCEGTLSVEHAPSQPFDVTTAFAVPNPGYPSQSSRIFRVWVFRELPR